MSFSKDYIARKVPQWIVMRTQENMEVYNMGLSDSFKEAIQNYPGLVKGSELWKAFYYDDFRKYIPSAYLPEYLDFAKYPLKYANAPEKVLTIRRNTTYIKFISARNTNACNVGDVMEAWKDDCGMWHTYNPIDGKTWRTSAAQIRRLAREFVEQDNSVLSPSWRLAH